MGRVAKACRLGSGALAVVLAFAARDARAEERPGSAVLPGGLVVVAVDAAGKVVDSASSHASLTRVLPEQLQLERPSRDDDALRWVAGAAPGKLPLSLSFSSTRPGGARLDELEDVPLEPASCPAGTPEGLECASTAAIRACSDSIDAGHPTVRDRSLLAEVGGRITAHAGSRPVASILVGGPRRTALGQIERLRARVRVRVVRLSRGGGVPIGGDEVGSVTRAKRELRTASGIWGQCGIHFGSPDQLDVAVVDPPPAHLLAVGCDLGLPASGGTIAFQVGGRSFELQTTAGQTPTQVANALAVRLNRAGLRATVSANAPTGLGALRTADVLVRNRDGTLVSLSTDGEGPLCSDATLRVCLGEVNLEDGLTHFTDFNARAGTVEERSLIKAFDDGDPTTLDIFLIPSFASSGRMGESFIFTEGASIANTVIMDRSGIRAGARSFTLAHEIGHILLDRPGHPDDYGIDRPSRLMDADAADGTIFGPRRLSVGECERALRQSGPDAPIPLLRRWPLERSSIWGR